MRTPFSFALNITTLLSLATITSLLLSACAKPPEEGRLGDDPELAASSSSTATSLARSSASHSPAVPASSVQALPTSLLLTVPFTSQAPFGNWDEPYQEACEEAVMLMLMHYENNTPITPAIADKDIVDLVAWETAHGYRPDINAAQMVEIADQRFGIKASVRREVTEESIKRALATGHPVIIPVAGRELGNPYYTGAGPWYHALVIVGYRRGLLGTTYFITNDPGTKHGERYEYKVSTILNAIHDWTGVKEEIAQGGKAMIVVESE